MQRNPPIKDVGAVACVAYLEITHAERLTVLALERAPSAVLPAHAVADFEAVAAQAATEPVAVRPPLRAAVFFRCYPSLAVCEAHGGPFLCHSLGGFAALDLCPALWAVSAIRVWVAPDPACRLHQCVDVGRDTSTEPMRAAMNCGATDFVGDGLHVVSPLLIRSIYTPCVW